MIRKNTTRNVLGYRSAWLIGYMLLSVFSFSQTTYYSRATGNWTDATKWSTVACGNATNTGTYPVAGDNAIICNGHTIRVNANSACATVTLQGSGILDFNTNSTTLSVSGNVSMSGTSQVTGNNSSRVMNIGGTLTVNSGANCNIDGITMAVTGITTIDGRVNFIDNTGSKTFNSSVNVGAGGTGRINFTSNETFTLATGDLNMYAGSSITGTTGTMSLTTGNFNVLGGTVTIGGTSFTVVAGSTTIDGTLQFAQSGSGNKSFRAVTISATGTWDNTVGEDPRMNGNIVNNGSWLGPTGGTCDYQFGRTVTGSYTISGNPVVFSRLSIENGTTVTNLGTIVLDGNVNTCLRNRTGAGTVTFNNGDGVATAILYLQNSGGASTIDVASNLTFNASFANNTVHYARGGNQDVRVPDDACYYNLVCAVSGTKSLLGNISIRNSVTIQDAAILDAGANTFNNGCGGTASLTMSGTSEFIIAKCAATVPEFTGTYTLSGGTITLDGACAQTLRSGINYYNLNFSGNNAASAVNMTGVTTINGDFTIQNSASISANSAFSMDCSKTFTYNSSQNTTLTAGQNITIGNFSQGSGGTLSDNGTTITVCGSSWVRSVATARFSSTGRVTFNPSSGSCDVTSTGAANITQFKNVTINASKTLVADANGMNIGSGGGADWSNNGTFAHNSGTITAVGNVTIQGSVVTTFNHLAINTGVTLTAGSNFNLEGNFTVAATGVFTPSTYVVTAQGGSAQALTKTGGGTITFYGLTINKTTGTTISAATGNATSISVSNQLTMTDGIFDLQTNALSGAGNFTATGGNLQLAKTTNPQPEITGTYALTGGMVTLNGNGAQTLRTSATGGSTYYDLLFDNTGAKTITGLLTINGDLTVDGAATLTANSAFTQAAGKTFTYSSSGATTLTAATNVTVGIYVQDLGTFNINGVNLSVRGSGWNKSGGTFTTSGRVIFNGASTQTYTDNGTVLANVRMNNNNGLTLNNDMTISTDLTFTNGIITTGSNNVILSAVGTTVTSAGTGQFVEGNLRKAIAAGVSNRSFEVGTGSNYTPIDFSFTAANTAGNLTCSSIAGDSPDIYASTINASKTVNRYWKMTNNSIATLRYSAVFNFINPGDLDAALDVTTDTVQRYNGTLWNSTTIGTRSGTTIQITGCTTPVSGAYEDFQIGNDYSSSSVWNRLTGANNWSNKATWIQDRRGGITTLITSPNVTGTGTSFTTELQVGDILMSQTAPGTVIGTIQSIADNTNLVLTANAATSNAAVAYGRQKVPDVNDKVNIGNPNTAAAGVTVNVDIANATCNKLTFTTMALSNTLAHNAGSVLTVQTNVLINQPGNANTNAWNVNSGTATVSGNVQIASGDNTANRVAKIYVTTGTLNIGTNLVYNVASAQAAAAVLDLTGGAGRVNLSGALSLLSTGATLTTAGTENVFNYNRTAGSQTVVIGTSAIVYRNLYLNNTSTNGATLSANVTTGNVTGDVRTQTGILDNGGFIIAGNAARTFEVVNGATFEMTGTANFPTGFGTFAFGASSNTKYLQSNAKNISTQTYGNLYVQPSGNVTHTLPNGTVNVQGDLIIGNGTNTSTLDGTVTNTLNVSGDLLNNANSTFNASNVNTFIAGNWTNNGTFTTGTRTVTFNGTGAQVIDDASGSASFYNFAVDKSAGSLTASGSTISLTTNNLTLAASNAGTFTAPATLSVTASNTAAVALNAGTFVAGNSVYVNGNWTNNGGTFTYGTGTVYFTTNSAAINGTAASQTFYDIVVNKSNGQTLSFGGSTTTVNVRNLTLSNGNMTAPTNTNVSGNVLLNNSGDTYTGGTNTNVGGNITYSSGTTNWGTNVTLNGSVSQILSGATFPAFTNLVINNSKAGNAIALSTPVTVNGVLTLTDGHIVTTSTNILTMETGSSVTVNAPVTQDSSFVKGPMQWRKNSTGAQTAVFPVGISDHYHRIDLTINHSTTNSTYYTASYTASSAMALGWSLPASLERVSYEGYWDMAKTGAATVSSASVKLYYTNWDGVTDAPNLRVAKASGSPWADMGGVGTAVPAGTITSTTNFTTFGDHISLANNIAGSNPLPVELLSLQVVPDQDVIHVKWTTASELNSDYFMVQRSKDGISFENVVQVEAAGVSSAILSYGATDYEPYRGISYYRLKQVDNNGNFTFSNSVAVKLEKTDIVSVYPNPADKDSPFNVSITGSMNLESVVVLRDVQGKLFYTRILQISSDREEISIDPQGLAPGVYFVVVSCNGKTYQKPVVIK